MINVFSIGEEIRRFDKGISLSSSVLTKLPWLIVGGCARSGTTVLGRLISSHPEIALLHESPSWWFFNTVEGFFSEERRHQKGNAFDVHKDSIFLKSEMERPLIEFLFREKFGDSHHIIGTKTPAYYDLAEASFPAFIEPKTIHVTRDPFTNVDSLSKFVKTSAVSGPSLTNDDVEHSFLHWMRAWNAAVFQSSDKAKFLHLFLDDLLLDSDQSVAAVRNFLDVGDGLDQSLLRSSPRRVEKSGVDWVLSSGLNVNHLMEKLPEIADLQEGWPSSSKKAFSEGQYFGWPVGIGDVIDFTEHGNSQYYKGMGISPPTPIGGYISNESGLVSFSIPRRDLERVEQVSIEVTSAIQLGPRHNNLVIDIFSPAGKVATLSAEQNGRTSTSFVMDAGHFQNGQTTLAFRPRGRVHPRAYFQQGNQSLRVATVERITIAA